MAFVVSLICFIVFASFQAHGIVTGDSGDLVTAAVTFGVPHPPGYPLYTFLGWITSFIPLYTPAWRVGLLSSLPHAIVIYFLYKIVYQFTRSGLASLLSCLMLAGNYVFFLYSVTPEVFALLDLSAICLLYGMYVWILQKKTLFLYVIALTLGLSVTHHHMIAFMIPSLAYVLMVMKKQFFQMASSLRVYMYVVLVFGVGLLPYAYVYFASRGSSMINWDNASTLPNFIRLFTRADYGTFQSGALMGQLISQRLLQVRAFIQYIYLDYHALGVFLIILGFIVAWKKEKILGNVLVIAFLCMGPLFLFYASFPILNPFTLGTLERFLLPSYLIGTICLGVGFDAVWQYLKLRTSDYPRGARYGVIGLWLLLSFGMAGINGASTLWRFQGLAQDQTAELFAKDYFIGLPEGSILIVSNDTTIFTTQYVRYALNFRQDVIVIQGGMLDRADYRKQISKIFPSFVVPDATSNLAISDVLIANAKLRPVYSNFRYRMTAGWSWVPHGLVFQLVSDEKLKSDKDTIAENESLWAAIHNPMNGILSRYNHLMLSDIRDVYTDARVSYAKILLNAQQEAKAEAHLLSAVTVANDMSRSDAYTYLGLSQLFQNKCNDALKSFSAAEASSYIRDSSISMYQAITYHDCLRDEAGAKIFSDEYKKRKLMEETPLNKAL